MAITDQMTIARRLEAERLIALARAMLIDPAEEIVAIFLDHAVDALHAIGTDNSPENSPLS